MSPKDNMTAGVEMTGNSYALNAERYTLYAWVGTKGQFPSKTGILVVFRAFLVKMYIQQFNIVSLSYGEKFISDSKKPGIWVEGYMRKWV